MSLENIYVLNLDSLSGTHAHVVANPLKDQRDEMKFGHELSSAEHDAPKEFQGHFLQVRSAFCRKEEPLFGVAN